MLRLINENLIWHDEAGDTEVSIYIDHYEVDGSLYIGLFDEEWKEPYTDLTVCLSDQSLKANEAYVDVNNNPMAMKFIEDNKLGVNTGKVGRSGFCVYPLYSFDLKRLEEVNKFEIPAELKSKVEEALAAVVPVDIPEEQPEDIEVTAEEPVAEPVEEKVVTRALSDYVNGIIGSVWNLISDINGAIVTFDEQFKKDEKSDVNEILNNIVTDLTIDIGMLNKVRELVDVEKEELIDKGEEKAEDIVGE